MWCYKWKKIESSVKSQSINNPLSFKHTADNWVKTVYVVLENRSTPKTERCNLLVCIKFCFPHTDAFSNSDASAANNFWKHSDKRRNC